MSTKNQIRTGVLVDGFPLFENPLEQLTDKQFAKSLDAWRKRGKITDPIDAGATIRYLNEAERRWRPS